jgi:hypothetical protein
VCDVVTWCHGTTTVTLGYMQVQSLVGERVG